MSERKFDDFDEWVSEYRDIHNNNIKISGTDSNYFSEFKIIKVKEHEHNSENIKILDLGCGDGNSEIYFRKYFPSAKIYGIDISEKSIAIAKSRNIPECYFNVYDGENIPYDDNVFDIIFIAGVLHHIDEKYHHSILKSCYRVLKNSGRIYVFEHNPYNPITRKIVKDCVFDKDAKLVTAKNISEKLKNVGFNFTNINYTIFFPRFKFFKYLIAYERYLKWCALGAQYYIRSLKYE